jgi:hypothetical protein
MTRTVAVDFDGVIHGYSRGWQDGTIYDEPVPGAFDALRTLMADYAVVIHTTRDPWPVAQWVEERSKIPTVVELDVGHKREFWDDQGQILVTRFKLPAVAYIDDRGIRFLNWEQALTDLAAAVRRE